MSRTQDRRIHDYLDGRLSESERAEFEARLADDAGLAERVQRYREIGGALRDDDAELSPGFYARARAEFSARQAPERHPWLRWLSWESAGLVAATALAIAVFVPGLMRDETAFSVTERPSEQRSAPKNAPPESRDEDDATAEKLRVGAPTDSRKKKEQRRDLQSSGVLQDEQLLEEKVEQQDASPPDGARDVEQDRFAPAPPRPKSSDRGAPEEGLSREESVRQLEPATGASAPGDTPSLAPAGRTFAFTGSEANGRVARPLPPGVVSRDEVRVVAAGGLADLLREARGPAPKRSREAAAPEPDAEAESETLGSAASAHRVVLIGPRERAFSCAGIRVLREPESWRIVISPAGPAESLDEHGCELNLPDDGLPFRVEQTADE